MRDKRLLLVEDNPRDEALTMRALRKHNIANEITVVRDGAEALDFLFCRNEYAGRDPVSPQMVLLDLKLPKVDGLQVLKEMRSNERTRRLPVVVFTSSSEQEDMLKSYDLGANSYVRKAVDFERFSEATRQLGMYWLLLNEAPPAE